LAEVGSKSLHLLVDELGNKNHGTDDYYLLKAINDLAEESHKDLIIKKLSYNRKLVETVARMGWEEDARDVLLNGLKGKSGYLPTEWIQASARLNDKEINPLLVEYFIHGSNKSWTYKAIKHLPGIDLKSAVDKAWKNAMYDHNGFGHNQLAGIAVQYGHKDALYSLIEGLEDTKDNNRWQVNSSRIALLAHLDFAGSNKEIIKWYNQNKDKLVFDEKSKKFKLPK